ncbi:MAG TPA: hypothetical protein VGZ23_18180 [bacterium]|nr:hypothetical protein [bacterium]
MREKSVGLGSRRGSDSLGPFAVVDPKGVRLDAVARFQLWAGGPAEVDAAITALNARVLADVDNLFKQGFLRMALESSPPADFSGAPLNLWRKYADYRVLYEYAYTDSDSAASLIARVPIDIDSQFPDSTVVTDEMARWDNVSAAALEVRGPFVIGGLWLLAFVPGAAPTAGVTLTRTFDGAVGAPVAHPSLAAFLAAAAGPGASERHASVTFASFGAFLAAFSSAGLPVFMGDWDLDGVTDEYRPLTLSIAPAISLPAITDRFIVTYQVPPFDRVAVVYLRATRGT